MKHALFYPFYVANVCMACDVGGYYVKRRYTGCLDFFAKTFDEIGIKGFFGGFGIYLGCDMLGNLL